MRTSTLVLFVTFYSSCLSSLSVAQYVQGELCGRLEPELLYNLEKHAMPLELHWLANIQYPTGVDRSCMATLINNQYLVTLAECLWDVTIRGVFFTITLEESQMGPNCITTRQKICPTFQEIDYPTIIHPDYQPSSNINNIGLMRLSHLIFIYDPIRPICLPPSDVAEQDFVAQHLMTAGLTVHARRFTKMYVHIVDDEMCQPLHNGTVKALCANSCDNGSKYTKGAPLVGVKVTESKAEYYYLIGMLLLTPKACVDSSPDVYLRLDSHMDWIRANIKYKT